MVLNASKCIAITFTRKRSSINFNYSINKTLLRKEDTVKDLGILLDSKLSFRDHIAFISAKASKNLGFLFRVAKHFTDIRCLKTLYCSLVRSTLEYAAVVWSPYYQNESQRIESIQKKIVRFALRNLYWRDPQNLPRQGRLKTCRGPWAHISLGPH